jgi:Exo-beta-D-glucosaminidase Ig-fold domain
MWSDNDVALWPGEKMTPHGTAHTTDGRLTVDVAGVNVAAATIPVR